LLEWPVINIEKVDPSLGLPDLLFVESFFGILSEVFGLENDHANSGPSAWSRLFDVDGVLCDLAVAIKELDNLAHLNLEWEPSDQQRLVTVVVCDLVSEIVAAAWLWATTTSAATTAASSGAKKGSKLIFALT